MKLYLLQISWSSIVFLDKFMKMWYSETIPICDTDMTGKEKIL